ncbi:MAG: DUF1972 domain-containing protein [Deltaproteobacteria bacterium]|jgi:glycosyltransferase involved in cell wall biosynthesis|nr:DUF1972 domain-containing protein [Deltaproteobacteria bacterium]
MKLQILGTRGIPAKHGGFETFTEHFSIYLKNKGWEVTVYCQEEGNGPKYEDDWQGIHRVHIPVNQEGAKGTIVFDWLSTVRAAKRKIPILTLGYNTAVFCFLYRFKGLKNIINMDGIEWRRGKWTTLERTWLYINEKFGAWLGNHLIADHPEIKNHLAQYVSPEKIKIIPYSAVLLGSADITQLDQFALKSGKYAILIARPEPENSILEIVQAYSSQKRGMPLVILGEYNPDSNDYQKAILDAAGNEIQFVGAIYHQTQVQALRFFTRFYIHGHTVGGTNPSLVEALGAGSPVLAHDNKFNRWVAGEGSLYFSTEAECAEKISELVENDKLVSAMKTASIKQYTQNFTADKVHGAYEQLLTEHGF